MPPTTPTVAGAGGTWPRFSETKDPRIDAQVAADACGAACARFVLRLVGVEPPPSQDELYERTGRGACGAKVLATAMNECNEQALVRPQGDWIGECIAATVDTLRESVPFIAMLYEFPRPWCHFVVVEQIGEETVAIVDPWRPGTNYSMTIEGFFSYWTNWIVRRGSRRS